MEIYPDAETRERQCSLQKGSQFVDTGLVDLEIVIAGDGHCSSYEPISEFRVVRVSIGRKYVKTINQILVCLTARW